MTALVPQATPEVVQAEPPPGWLPMHTAPDSGRYWVINPMTGPYLTEPKGGQWPKVGWGDTQGTFYPMPYGWKPMEGGESS